MVTVISSTSLANETDTYTDYVNSDTVNGHGYVNSDVVYVINDYGNSERLRHYTDTVC